MRHLYMLVSAAALSFFTYSQQQGMALFSGGDSYAQQSSAQRSPGGRSSTVSHK